MGDAALTADTVGSQPPPRPPGPIVLRAADDEDLAAQPGHGSEGGSGGETAVEDGHMIGWEHLMVHQLHHLLTCIANARPVGPHGATFEDGYRAAEVCDAILRSAKSGRREAVRSAEVAGAQEAARSR
jgi:predicted dehydrogenase